MVLLGVKAHDVRAFAASKAFYGGVSMDQIMQACHWKSHNTFTRFYLKDLAGQATWAPSSQHSRWCLLPHQLQGQKKGGHKTGNRVDGACQNPDTIERTFHHASGN